MSESVCVIPSKLANRHPVFITREAVEEVILDRVGLTLKIIGRTGQVLATLLTTKEEMYKQFVGVKELLFPGESQRVEEIAAITGRFLAPLAMESIDYAGGLITLRLRSGGVCVIQKGGFATYKSLVELVYGKDFAQTVVPFVAVQIAQPVRVPAPPLAPAPRLSWEDRHDASVAAAGKRIEAVTQVALSAKHPQRLGEALDSITSEIRMCLTLPEGFARESVEACAPTVKYMQDLTAHIQRAVSPLMAGTVSTEMIDSLKRNARAIGAAIPKLYPRVICDPVGLKLRCEKIEAIEYVEQPQRKVLPAA